MTDWMQLPVGFDTGLVVAVANHLWQSTVFAMVAWLLTLVLRQNQDRTRYKLWMLASAKFLVPFSLLMGIGERLDRRMARPVEPAAYSWVTYDLAAPYKASTGPAKTAAVAPNSGSSVSAPFACASHGVWLALVVFFGSCGTLFLLARWGWCWWRLRAAVRTAKPVGIACGVPMLETRLRLEPGVFGIVRPVLLLPEGIRERLTEPQMEAIVEHELCHVRRRDNLTAALHMLVEALFWFHPAVWWIRARLIEERERAYTAGLSQIFDHGLQLQTSTMVVPKSFQLYLGRSTVFGKYGHPWDVRAGMNWFPWKNRVVRWNTEGLYLYNSPVGYSSAPFTVGGHGLYSIQIWEMAF